MAEWVDALFSSAPGLQRANPIGLIVLGMGAVIGIFGGHWTKKHPLAVQLAGLGIAIVGTFIALYVR